MEKSCFIGIDVSKDTLDVATHEIEHQEKFREKQFKNDTTGYKSLLAWIKKTGVKCSSCVFCMEHTGVYSLTPSIFLSEQGLFVCVEPALKIKRSMGITRGKNDVIDARRIAVYAMEKRSKLEPFIVPAKQLLRIKQLLTYRAQLRKVCASFKNSIKSHKRYEQNSEFEFVSSDLANQITEQEKKIKTIDGMINEIINQEKDLKNNSDLARSVIGIGPVVTAFLLVYTNNFTCFDNARKFNCYTGVAPFENTSGSSIRGKTTVSHLANKRMKTLLYNAANSAVNADPELRNYYLRKKSEGKDHQLIMNAICCKLMYRVFAVVKRKSPYVSLYKEKIEKTLA